MNIYTKTNSRMREKYDREKKKDKEDKNLLRVFLSFQNSWIIEQFKKLNQCIIFNTTIPFYTYIFETKSFHCNKQTCVL